MAEREPIAGLAVAAVREDGNWQCSALDASALTELDAALTELRKVRSSGAVLGLLAVDDEFFIVIRPAPSKISLLLSDAAAALDYDIAADVLDVLRVPTPSEDDDEVWSEGDLEILADFGLPADELELIAGEIDLYPDEQLQMIAQRCGFGEEFTELLDQD
ncbi:tRNA adenosine deaminase-associated protein [Haloechinothrix sp. LS1_15]|uniref:tRNA adenosine deaminase-associated protein n=1 Tax=Haloechinothrix sp. LS1_15 TaxID=2652248 RepID=UPI0029477D59|nr:tRNA adenosine deaminase-associated protein [Haloechinothrix sp. LS1_15]MDV6011255.1 tRNA adenosine deaminase [Haloechinothrix sp. LS1_15]